MADIGDVSPAGSDIARWLLEAYRAAAGPAGEARARAAATRRGAFGDGSRTPVAPSPGVRRGRRGWSGPGPDERDPALLGSALADIVRTQGWQDARDAGLLELRWAGIVGPDVAWHCRPARLVDGDLLVEATSTAWATQLRHLAPRLLERFRDELGEGVVRSVRVVGPTTPSWSRGRLRVKGRGPRDTYG